jgi:hypothetical protein
MAPPWVTTLTLALNIIDYPKMFNGLIHVLFRIWDSIEPPGSEGFNDKLPMQLVVIYLRKHFLQAQHERGESTFH